MLPDFRVRQRDYLLEISRALTQELDLDKLLERILNISIEMLAGQAGIIALRSQTQGWQIRVSTGLPPAFLEYLEAQFSQSTDFDNPIENEVLVINRILSAFTQAVTMGRLSSVGLPLNTGGHTVGVIFVFRQFAAFSPNDRILLSSFADQAAIAVHNAQLYKQVENDRRRVNALLDSAADGILILLPDLKVERCNPAFCHMVSQKLEALQNRSHEEVVRWTKQPQQMTLEQAVAGGWPLTSHTTLYVEGDLERPAGFPPLPVGITYAPLISDEGNLINIITTVRDITRFRQAEEMKSTFISVVSHELKTPVALIKGYVGTLRREDTTWDRAIVKESLQVIEEEADRLSGYIENLLDATRLQASGFNVKRSDLNIGDLINHVAERFRTQTGKHTISVQLSPNLPIVLADETRIYQVFSNLISNAIKYSPGGDICLSAEVHGENIVCGVSDVGPGIDPNDLPFVFDRFYRSPDAIRQTKGAGLGLYLAKAIVEAHGGKMWVDPEYVKGARVCFSLPIIKN
ncbi:MAG: ATP-binding protein [Anaerolineaceae bacterium]